MATLVEVISALRTSPEAVPTPAYAEVSLIGACNFGCVQCHQHHHMREDRAIYGRPGARALDRDRALALIEELGDMTVPTIELCGRGEPTLFPGIAEVVDRAKARGMRGTLITNGSRLGGDLVDAIAASGWDEVSVSMYGGTDESFAAVTRARGGLTLRTIADNVVRLKEAAPRTRVTMGWLIQSDALGGLEGMLDLVERLPVDQHHFLPIVPYAEGRIHRGAAHAREDARLAKLVREQVAQLSARRPIPEVFAAWVERFLAAPTTDTIATTYWRVPCYAGRWAVFVCDDGTVRPCSNSNWVMGDLAQQSLEQIWTGDEYRRFRECAQTHIRETGTPIPHSTCSHCGWARLQRQLHDAVTAPGAYDAAWLADPF